MSTAIVDADGNVRQLDARADAPVVVSAEDVKDVEKLARLLNDARREIAELRRRRDPRRLVYEDYEVTTGVEWRVEHNLGGRVRWFVIDWVPNIPGDSGDFERTGDSEDDALVLVPANTGLVTLLVEEAD